MIFQLHIDEIAPQRYRAQIVVDSVPVHDPADYSSLEAAIREEAEVVPDELARFMEVRFAGLSSGTFRCPELAANAASVAAKLSLQLEELTADERR
jgi:hypothetical protein